MVKEQVKTKEQQSSKTNENLISALDAILESPTRKTKRMVNLKYESCCGCGCDVIDVKRTVDSDSELQDGDYITELLPSDNWD